VRGPSSSFVWARGPINLARQGFGTLQQGQGYVQFCLFGGDNVYAASLKVAAVKN